jgi:hypothetical protein
MLKLALSSTMGAKPHPGLDYIDMEWIIKDANGRGTGVSLVLRANGAWEFWGQSASPKHPTHAGCMAVNRSLKRTK